MSLEKIFADVFALQASTVNDQLELASIPAWDSLTHMMLIVQLEDTYKIQLSGDEIADMKSVGDARRALQAHGATP
ncbi:MAG: acyl carrier protein [Burkholderiales bacterium]|nr:acyl carrier protein [Burkholderiales bacterium]